MKSVLLIVFICLAFNYILAQNGLDYRHKSLVKTLKKAGIDDISSAIGEMMIPDSLPGAIFLNGKFFVINNIKIKKYKYVYVGRVNSCRAGGCSLSSESADNLSPEYFDYYVLFDDNKTIQQVKVFNYQASHGYEITARGWLKQFIGYNGVHPLLVDKQIDGISGATISVCAITHDISIKTEMLHQLVMPGM